MERKLELFIDIVDLSRMIATVATQVAADCAMHRPVTKSLLLLGRLRNELEHDATELAELMRQDAGKVVELREPDAPAPGARPTSSGTWPQHR